MISRARRGRWSRRAGALLLPVAALVAGGTALAGVASAAVGPVSGQSAAAHSNAVAASGGFWLAASDGAVFAAGPAPDLGGTLTSKTNPVVGIAATHKGEGYWVVEANGTVIPFGTARSHGSLPGEGVHVSDIVAIAPTGDDGGYWLIGRDGGEFAFGDAHYHGSLPGVHVHVHNVVGMVATSDGGGYWLVGTDGGVFAFGNAGFVGSLPSVHVHVNNVRAMIPSSTRHGYVLVGSDGGAFVFGTGVHFYGSLPGRGVHVHNIVGLALTTDSSGYWMAGAGGSTYAFGKAPPYTAPAAVGANLPVVAIAGAPPLQFPNTTSANWQIQQTPVDGTGGQLNAVRCTAFSNCEAVGWYFTRGNDQAFAEAWNGSKWSAQVPPQPNGTIAGNLLGVSCPSSSRCVAVGWYEPPGAFNPASFAEVWNGKTWSFEVPPSPGGSNGTQLTAVSCAAANACTAVGSYTNSIGTIFTLAESWNGSRWTTESTPNPGQSQLSEFLGVACPSAGACTAVGNYTTNGNTEVTLGEQSSGAHWSITKTVVPTGSSAGTLHGVTCITSSNCYAVGDYVTSTVQQTTLAEHWNGNSWGVTPTPGVKGTRLSELDGLSCISSSNCTAVGWYTNAQNTFTTAEAWNGSGWSTETTPNPSGAPSSRLAQVSCAALNFCTAVGNTISPNPTNHEDLPLAEQWVREIGTATTLTSSAPKASTGQSVTFTAKVIPTETGFGSPSGSVVFSVTGKGQTLQCNGGNSQVLSGGFARCTIPSDRLQAALSPYSVRATFGGPADFKASSATLNPAETVVKDNTTIVLRSSANAAVYSQAFSLTAMVTANNPGSGNPSGNTTFSIDGRNVCTGAKLSGGKATCAITSYLPVGKHTVLVSYAGDSNYNSSSNGNAPLTEIVNKDGTTLTITSNLNPSTYTQSGLSFTATVKADAPGRATPTGTVSFTIDGRADCDDGTSTFTLGSQKGDQPNQATCPMLTTLNAGTHPVIGTYSGDAGFGASSNSKTPFIQTVKVDPTTTVLNCTVAGNSGATSPCATPLSSGRSVTLHAVVTPNAGNTNGVPFGNVTFTFTLQGGSAQGFTCTNNNRQDIAPIAFNTTDAKYEAVCTTFAPSVVGTFTYTFTASYPGSSAGYGSSVGTITETIFGGG